MRINTDPDRKHKKVNRKVSVADPGCFLPDPNFSITDPGSASTNLRILTSKPWFYVLGNMIWVVHPGSGSWLFSHPWFRGQKGTGSRIRNTAESNFHSNTGILYLLERSPRQWSYPLLYMEAQKHTDPPDPEHWWHIYIILQGLKVIKKLQNSRNQGFSYYFCLMMEGSWAKSWTGSLLVTNGYRCKCICSYYCKKQNNLKALSCQKSLRVVPIKRLDSVNNR